MTQKAKAPLGILQPIWDTWNEAHERVMNKPVTHFPVVLGIQVVEVLEALEAGDKGHAAEETVDIISVSMNWMRWLGLSAEQVVEIIKSRTANRYAGQANAILDKYLLKYNI